MRARLLLCALLAALGASAYATDAPLWAPRLYRTTTETGLPHLEENLRYATTHETRCLGAPQLADAFPILHHVAFQGCTLGDAHAQGDVVSLTLHCAPGSETTGSAHWRIDASGLAGTFEARLGAKNMTLYQRITGRAVGACNPGT